MSWRPVFTTAMSQSNTNKKSKGLHIQTEIPLLYRQLSFLKSWMTGASLFTTWISTFPSLKIQVSFTLDPPRLRLRRLLGLNFWNWSTCSILCNLMANLCTWCDARRKGKVIKQFSYLAMEISWALPCLDCVWYSRYNAYNFPIEDGNLDWHFRCLKVIESHGFSHVIDVLASPLEHLGATWVAKNVHVLRAKQLGIQQLSAQHHWFAPGLWNCINCSNCHDSSGWFLVNAVGESEPTSYHTHTRLFGPCRLSCDLRHIAPCYEPTFFDCCAAEMRAQRASSNITWSFGRNVHEHFLVIACRDSWKTRKEKHAYFLRKRYWPL